MAGRRRTGVVALVLALLLGPTACSWGGQEPGLFSTPGQPSVDATEPGRADLPGPTDPSLPVLGQRLWVSGDGSRVVFRFAVHAVRRTAEATVLDWSVTPLAEPGRRAGEPVPAGTDLGLERQLEGEQDIALLDTANRRAYRPVADVASGQFRRCLCTPLYAVTPQLRFGETRLLQLTFLPLALGTFRVDVVFPNVEVVPGVPVTQVSGTPVATGPTDLTRPAAAGNPVTGEQTYTVSGRGHRHLGVLVNRVVASRGITSVVWTLHAVDDSDGESVGSGPPVARTHSGRDRIVTPNPADGPRLRTGDGDPVGARWTTATFAGAPAYECLCSDVGLWAKSLREGGGSAHLATQVGPLPRGTRRVEVDFPGLRPFTDVPVTWVDDVAPKVEQVEPGTDATWTYDVADPPRGWLTTDWPTPLPAGTQVTEYTSTPERILAALPGS